MVWVRETASYHPLRADTRRVDGKLQVMLTINGFSVGLNEDDAASLGGYLLGVTNNEDEPELPFPDAPVPPSSEGGFE